MSRFPLVPAVLALTGSISGSLPAEEPAPSDGRFAEQIEVRVVEVEVSVRDRNGLPVTGLAKDDFRLLVDGKPVAIDYFAERQPESAVALPGVDGASPAGDAAAQPVNVLIYLDEEYALPIDLERVLASLEADLGALRSYDRVAIVAWDGHRLEKLLDWAAPGPAVATVLTEARKRPAWGLRSRLDEGGRSADRIPPGWQYGPRSLDLVPFNCGGFEGSGSEACVAAMRAAHPALAAEYYLEVENRIDRTARAAAAAIRSFAQREGRRIVALLSGGWENGLRGADGRLASWDPILDVADQLRYSIYAVDVPGLSNDFRNDTTRYGADSYFSEIGTGFGEAPADVTLRYLSDATGGEALLDGERGRLFARIAEQGRSYYSVAFDAKRAGDDASHDIRVEVPRLGVEVRHRVAYRDLSASAELGYELEASLLDAGSKLAEPTLVASLGESRRESVGRMVVPLTIRVPELPALPELDANRALELRVAAVDKEGRRVVVGPVEVRGDSAGKIEVPMRLRRSSRDLAVSLHDPASGESYLASLRVAP